MEEHTTIVPDGNDDANLEGATVGRRGAIRRLAGYTAAALVGGAILAPGRADATTGAMTYGVLNDEAAGTTFLYSTSSNATMWFNNTGNGYALGVEKTSGTGVCLVVIQDTDGSGILVSRNNIAATGAGVEAHQYYGGPVYVAMSHAIANTEPLFRGEHHGIGTGIGVALTNTGNANPAVDASTVGTGPAMHAKVINRASVSPAIRAETSGKGPALYGSTAGAGAAVVGNGGTQGRGGTYISNVAQMRLQPGSSSSHPREGLAGDLFVDAHSRLWFCKGGAVWNQLA